MNEKKISSREETCKIAQKVVAREEQNRMIHNAAAQSVKDVFLTHILQNSPFYFTRSGYYKKMNSEIEMMGVRCVSKEKIEEINKEEELRSKMQDPMVYLRYSYVVDVILAKLRLINADLSGKCGHIPVRSMSSRIKAADSIEKKLLRKKREVTFENAVRTLNDIAGVRVVCYFCDDIYNIADALRSQKDIRVLKEKDYIKYPKKSGYQSMHLIVEVPFTYLDQTEPVKVEVQIRSFAMDYWAELDNQMCYKKSAGQIEHVERETRNYSNLIADVDNQMLGLRRKIEKLQYNEPVSC